MADEAIVTIKSDAEIGLGLLNDPKDVDILDGPDLVLPAGRILRLMIEMMAQRGNEPRRYILYANLNGRWYPIDRLVRPGRVRPTDLLWLFAFPGVGLHPEAEENVIVKLNPTREQLLDLALWSTIRDTIGSRMLAPPGSLWFGRDQIIRKIGFLLGVRLWDIEWAGRSPGERQRKLRFVCDRGPAVVPLRSVQGQTSAFRGEVAGNSLAFPQKLPREEWDAMLSLMSVVTGHDLLGAEHRERLRARYAQALAATPAA